MCLGGNGGENDFWKRVKEPGDGEDVQKDEDRDYISIALECCESNSVLRNCGIWLLCDAMTSDLMWGEL